MAIVGALNKVQVDNVGAFNKVSDSNIGAINKVEFVGYTPPPANKIGIRESGGSWPYTNTVHSEWNGSTLLVSSIDVSSNIYWHAEYDNTPPFTNYWWLSTASGGPGEFTSISIIPVGSLPAGDVRIRFIGNEDSIEHADLVIEDKT